MPSRPGPGRSPQPIDVLEDARDALDRLIAEVRLGNPDPRRIEGFEARAQAIGGRISGAYRRREAAPLKVTERGNWY